MEMLCRTCLATIDGEETSVSLSNKTEMGETVGDLLVKYCCLEISDDDQLPKQICTTCLYDLTATVNYRQKCENSDSNLRHMLQENAKDAQQLEANIELEPVYVGFADIQEDTETNLSQPANNQNEYDTTNADCYTMIEMMSFRCCLCSAILYSEEEYREHIEHTHYVTFPENTAPYDIQLTCFICSQVQPSMEELKAHQGKSFLELFQCNNCEDVYESSELVLQHNQQNHSIKMEEKLEEITYETYETIEKATSNEMKTKKYPKERYCCVTHCHEVFPDESQLLVHAQEKHELKLRYNKERNQSPNKAYICNVCFRSFGSLKNLKVHQFVRANHVTGKHFSCVHCSFRTVSRNLLTVHERSKHSGERPFECSHCDKRFFSEMHLKNHSVCHSSERPFPCSYCEKTFIRKRNMEEHIRSCHSSEKPFKCDVCPARFKVAQHLRIHTRIHSGEKPYKCSYCDNSYYHISDRKRHEMSHTGEKPHKCNDCGAAFARKRTLTIHERTHTGERPFGCKHCNKTFCQSTTLKKHMERHMAHEMLMTGLFMKEDAPEDL